MLVLLHLQAFDTALTFELEQNDIRNKQKSYYLPDLNEWKINEVRPLELLTKADVIRAMHERVQWCQDVQT